MKYLDEYRSPELAQKYAREIRTITTQPWTIMEVCGGQTHSIVRYGLKDLLPSQVELVHGPGCPVCVTPISHIDLAVEIAKIPGCALCSFGDMLRVPGSCGDLLSSKAAGADVRPVYSPLDAVKMAQNDPSREYVFFAVGFETTAPANALAIRTAALWGLTNFSVLVAHVRVPPALEAILTSPGNRVQGFLAAGHVCAIMGTQEYVTIAETYGVPIVVTGFEPVDLLLGVLCCINQLEQGRHEVENPYSRVVRECGNSSARSLVDEVFVVGDREWRGLGIVGNSGLHLSPAYRSFDATGKFGLIAPPAASPSECQAAEVLRGRLKPDQCPAFGCRCTPEAPLGAPMVSSEGACAAYYRYRPVESP
ncbi:MAG: hydrogenase formation protein HypD [Armatimonadetes bacterium]|nr:hydrogenase formation protein HypD [Armatimonadota bacterium]